MLNRDLIISPFLKWAGGKRWLIHQCIDIFPKQNEYNVYYEPFLGSAAVFFHLKPFHAVLSDINAELIDTYKTIKSSPSAVVSLLKNHHNLHSKEHYYHVRNALYSNDVEKAARFIYLNRTCWNGLYRVNNSGGFNVPIGTKTKVILDNDNFEAVAKLLENAIVLKMDFEEAMQQAQKNDFIFVDPPYTVKHNSNAFVQYNETLFSWADQVRLRDSVESAVSRGVKVLVTNANHSSIRELYDGLGDMICLSRASVLASNPEKRGKYEELAIKCGY